MDTKKLRQKILDLAIHGKLVPQDPNDEPASVLLERIRAEKEQLIKEGKIKAPKKSKSAGDTSHYPKDVPFEVPEGWVWCKITDVVDKLTDGTHNSPKSYPSGAYMYVTAKNIKRDGIDVSRITYVTEDIHREIYSRCNPEKGDILYIKDGATCGISTINNLDKEFSLLSSVALIKPNKSILNTYLNLFLQSDFCYRNVRDSMKGVGITRIILKQMELWNIPLPPFAEQKRIVAAAEQLLQITDEVEREQTVLGKTIKKTKERILDLAIHGKLVPQDSSDEPAIELLKRITPAFQPSHNLHYGGVLPSGWTVCCLEDILDYEQPQAYIVNSTDYLGTYKTPVLTPGKSFILGYTNEDFGICDRLPVIIFDDFTTESKYVDFPFKVKSSAMKILHARGEINLRYVALLMSIIRLAGDTHKRYWISEYSKIPVPIPPLHEQERIVSAVQLLFNQLDNLIAGVGDD